MAGWNWWFSIYVRYVLAHNLRTGLRIRDNMEAEILDFAWLLAFGAIYYIALAVLNWKRAPEE